VSQLLERLRVIGAQQKRAANLAAAETLCFRRWNSARVEKIRLN